MNTFNLTFWGEILPGQDPDKVKARFARLFDIRDPERLEHFFSGQQIVLRRNLDRKAAAEYYAKLHKLGVEAALVKVGTESIPPTREPLPDQSDEPAGDEWEEARRRAELEVIQRARQDAAARRRDAEQQRRRDEQRAEQERQAQAQELRRAAEQAEAARRKAEEERARKASEAEAVLARKRREAEETARREAEQAEAHRLKAEEKARREAEQAETQRLRAEQEARRAAEQAEARRLKAEEKARREAEQAEARRLKAEEKAREKAIAQAEANKRKAAREAKRREKAARRQQQKAELAERKRAEAEQRKQAQAEQAAREATEREAERSRKAALAARRRAELQAAREEAERQLAQKKAEAAERQRLREQAAARDAALREAERQRDAEQASAARAREEAALQKQAQARLEALARQKADREQQRAAERQRREQQRLEAIAREEARDAERRQLEDSAIIRGAAALTGQAPLKKSRAGVRSRIDLPRRVHPAQAGARRRQPGAPNDYQARPFRSTAVVRERASQAARQMRLSMAMAAAVLAGSLLLLGSYTGSTPVTVIAGTVAATVSPGGQLALMAGQQLFLHDRAGVGRVVLDSAALGLEQMMGPIKFTSDGQLLLFGAPLETDSEPVLQRCDLDTRTCLAVGGVRRPAIVDLQVNPVNDELFLVDGSARRVSKLSRDGQTRVAVTLPMAARPVLQLDSGLMLVNSHEGPAISVRRYEDQAFGQQLDEVLLLPPGALERGEDSVFDFARAGEYWWVSMVNPVTGSAGLYVFDSNWKTVREIDLPELYRPALLQAWSARMLVLSPQTTSLLRYSAAGTPEADYRSDLLEEVIEQQRWVERWLAIAWATAFALCLVLVCTSLAYTYWQYLRNLVFRARPTRGAESLDPYWSLLDWIDPAAARQHRLRRVGMRYALLCAALLLLCIGLGASVTGLIATLLALAGPAAALYLYARGNTGHAGVAGDMLALVDHRDMYHLASDARIQYRGSFLSIDDVIVFTGTALLPNMDPAQVRDKLRPVVETGARVDRKTILVKLLENQHPLALGALAVAVGLMAALAVLVLGLAS